MGTIIKREEKTAINNLVSNNDDNEIKIEFNYINLFKRLKNENEYSIFENEEIYEDMINSYINLVRNENINIYKKELSLEEIDINNNLDNER